MDRDHELEAEGWFHELEAEGWFQLASSAAKSASSQALGVDHDHELEEEGWLQRTSSLLISASSRLSWNDLPPRLGGGPCVARYARRYPLPLPFAL